MSKGNILTPYGEERLQKVMKKARTNIVCAYSTLLEAQVTQLDSYIFVAKINKKNVLMFFFSGYAIFLLSCLF
jgi:hypothetical protein